MMLFSLFGDQLQKEDLAGVVIDRACDVHPMAQVKLFLWEEHKRLEFMPLGGPVCTGPQWGL